MVDITREKRLSMDDAAEVAGVTRQTIYAWARRKRGRRLETAKLGGGRITTLEALQRFIDQDSEADVPQGNTARMTVEQQGQLAAMRARHGI